MLPWLWLSSRACKTFLVSREIKGAMVDWGEVSCKITADLPIFCSHTNNDVYTHPLLRLSLGVHLFKGCPTNWRQL